MAEKGDGDGGSKGGGFAGSILAYLRDNAVPALLASAGAAAAVSFEQFHLGPFGFDLPALATFGDAPELILRNTASFLLFGVIAAMICGIFFLCIACLTVAVPWLGEKALPSIGGGWAIVVVTAGLAASVLYYAGRWDELLPFVPVFVFLLALAWLLYTGTPVEAGVPEAAETAENSGIAHGRTQPPASDSGATAAESGSAGRDPTPVDGRVEADAKAANKTSWPGRLLAAAGNAGKGFWAITKTAFFGARNTFDAAARRATAKGKSLAGQTEITRREVSAVVEKALAFRLLLLSFLGVLAWVIGGMAVRENSKWILCNAGDQAALEPTNGQPQGSNECNTGYLRQAIQSAPIPLLRPVNSYSIVFKTESQGYDLIGSKPNKEKQCPHGVELRGGICVVISGGVSAPMLFLGEYGGRSLFFSPGPGGGSWAFPTADISTMAPIALTRNAKGEKPQSHWLGATWSALAAAFRVFVPKSGETRTVIAIERERKDLTGSIARLSEKVSDFAGAVREVGDVLGVEKKSADGGEITPKNRGEVRRASLRLPIAMDAAPESGANETRETIIKALRNLGAGVNGLQKEARAIRNGLKDVHVTNSVEVENAHFARLPGIHEGLKDVNVTNVVSVANGNFEHLPAIKTNTDAIYAGLAPKSGENPDAHIARRLDGIEQAIKNIPLNAPFSGELLPDAWLGVPPRIVTLCKENTIRDAMTGNRIGFPVRATAPTREELGRKLPGLVQAIFDATTGEAPNGWAILVEGSADSRGTAMANLTIAEKRASHIQDRLESEILARARSGGPLHANQDNWEIVSYGIGEQFRNDSTASVGDAASPRVVRVKLCERAANAERVAASGN